MSACMSVRRFIYLPVYPSVYPTVCLLTCLLIYLSVCLCVRLFVFLFICLPSRLCFFMFAFQSICLLRYSSHCLFISLSVSTPIGLIFHSLICLSVCFCAYLPNSLLQYYMYIYADNTYFYTHAYIRIILELMRWMLALEVDSLENFLYLCLTRPLEQRSLL